MHAAPPSTITGWAHDVAESRLLGPVRDGHAARTLSPDAARHRAAAPAHADDAAANDEVAAVHDCGTCCELPGSARSSKVPAGHGRSAARHDADASHLGADAAQETPDAARLGGDAGREAAAPSWEGADAPLDAADPTRKGSDATRYATDATRHGLDAFRYAAATLRHGGDAHQEAAGATGHGLDTEREGGNPSPHRPASGGDGDAAAPPW